MLRGRNLNSGSRLHEKAIKLFDVGEEGFLGVIYQYAVDKVKS